MRGVKFATCPGCKRGKYISLRVGVCSSCQGRYVVNPIGMLVRVNEGRNIPRYKGPLSQPKRGKLKKSPKFGRVVKPGAAEKKAGKLRSPSLLSLKAAEVCPRPSVSPEGK